MSRYIKKLRNDKLGYGLVNFGVMFGHPSPSWADGLESGGRLRKTINFYDLRSIFIVDYNYELFTRKLKKIDALIAEAKEQETITEDITTSDIFNTDSRIFTEQNLNKFVPPLEIFGTSKETLETRASMHITQTTTDKYKKYQHIFSEDKFPEEEQYMPIISSDSEYYKLSFKRIACFEKFVADRCEKLLKLCNVEEKTTEYWLYAMIMMHKTIYLERAGTKYMETVYKKAMGDDSITWRKCFSMLNDNKNLKDGGSYTECNVIYFKDIKQSPISRNNLPIFYVKYDFSVLAPGVYDHFDAKLDMLYTSGKIKLVDLFMFFFQLAQIEGSDEEKAFIKAYDQVNDYHVELPFDVLGLINLPEKATSNVPFDLLEFMILVDDFFHLEPDKRKNDCPELELLRKNLYNYQQRFINIIALDFSDIEKIGEGIDYKLRDELQKALNNFIARDYT